MDITQLVRDQRTYFNTGITRNLAFRRHALQTLERAIRSNEAALCAAMQKDLNKCAFESYMCEIGLVLDEIDYALKNLERWAKPHRVKTPLAQFCARSFTLAEPLGVTLIMSPWNYPFLLTMDPLVGALAAGNCAVVKPSDYSANTSAAMAKLLADCFAPEYVTVVEGGRAQNTALLEQQFDYIFFTGSVGVGKLVMEKAAQYVTPITLELGGKSPCIVDETADIPLAARRIAWGKFLNAGQTCVAPDYILCHESVKEPLLAELQKNITAFFGADPLKDASYGRIINEKHYQRLLGLLDGVRVVCGGTGNPDTLQIAPTLLDNVTGDSAVMQEEIFGPLLPVLTYRTLDEAIAFVNGRPKPLALYLFSNSKATQDKVLHTCSYGGGCINDTVVHLASHAMPFGGVGESGMGSYHGKKSFDTFSHHKSIVHKANWMDLPVRYRPYTAEKNKLLRLFLK